jgi:hypothetical protein
MKKAVVLFAAVLMTMACESSAPFTGTVSVAASQESSAGGRSQLVVSVTNSGPAIPHLGLTFMTADRWYELHDVTDSGPCAVDLEQFGFDCGDLAAGASATYSIAGVAKEPGTYHYRLALRSLARPFHYVNDHADGADALVWDEIVTAKA